MIEPSRFAGDLLEWYDRSARSLPWRISPADRAKGIRPDPYRVWLSEVMLQQTTVAAVKGYFERFTTRWPKVQDLAQAEDDEVMGAWAGLGYYARARNLLACARDVSLHRNGRFPETAEELRTLPGIGDYTSAAIAAIAFDEPAPVVDGNIERVTTSCLRSMSGFKRMRSAHSRSAGKLSGQSCEEGQTFARRSGVRRHTSRGRSGSAAPPARDGYARWHGRAVQHGLEFEGRRRNRSRSSALSCQLETGGRGRTWFHPFRLELESLDERCR